MRIHSMDSSDPFNVMYILNHYIVEVDHNLRARHIRVACGENCIERYGHATGRAVTLPLAPAQPSRGLQAGGQGKTRSKLRTLPSCTRRAGTGSESGVSFTGMVKINVALKRKARLNIRV